MMSFFQLTANRLWIALLVLLGLVLLALFVLHQGVVLGVVFLLGLLVVSFLSIVSAVIWLTSIVSTTWNNPLMTKITYYVVIGVNFILYFFISSEVHQTIYDVFDVNSNTLPLTSLFLYTMLFIEAWLKIVANSLTAFGLCFWGKALCQNKITFDNFQWFGLFILGGVFATSIAFFDSTWNQLGNVVQFAQRFDFVRNQYCHNLSHTDRVLLLQNMNQVKVVKKWKSWAGEQIAVKQVACQLAK